MRITRWLKTYISGIALNIAVQVNAIKNRLSLHWPSALPIVAIVAVYHSWVGPGTIVGDDFHQLSPRQLAALFPWPTGWDDSLGFGRSLPLYYSDAPVRAVGGLLYHFGVQWPLIERILWLFPFLVFAVAAPYALLYRLTRIPAAAAVGAIIFALNTWTIGLTERGHIPSLVAYSIMPIIVIQWLGFLAKPTLLRALGVSAVVTLQVSYDVRYAYISAIVALVILAHGIFAGRYHRTLKSSVIAVGYLSLCMTILNIYWIAPAATNFVSLGKGYTSLEGFIQISRLTDLLHSLTLFFPFYHHVAGSNGFFVDAVEPAFFTIPIAALLGVALSWKQRRTQVAAILIIIGVIVSSGSELPFGPINRFLFLHLPGMIMFRDITKFSALVAFAYASAIAFGVAALLARWRSIGAHVNRLKVPVVALAIGGYVLLMHDAYNPARYSNFKAYSNPRQDLELVKFLSERPGSPRSIVFPTPGAYLVAPGNQVFIGGEDLAYALPPNGVYSLLDDEYDPFNFYKSPLAWPLLRSLNVRYLIVHDDSTGEDFRTYEYNVQRAEAIELFRTRRWLRELTSIGKNVVFKVRDARDIAAFTAPNPLIFEGPPRTLAALAGTEFVHERMAVFLGDQLAMPQGRRNFVRSAYGVEPASEDMYPLHRRRDFGFIGTAMLASAMSVKSLDARGKSGLAFEFPTPSDENVALHLVSRLRATKAYTIEPDHVRLVKRSESNPDRHRLYDDANPVAFGEGLEATDAENPGPGTWFAIGKRTAVISVANSTSQTKVADITFPAIVSDARYVHRVRFAVSNASGRVTYERDARVCGAMTCWLLGGGSRVTLERVPLQPGRSKIVVVNADRSLNETFDRHSLFVRADVAVTPVTFSESDISAWDARPLTALVSVRRGMARIDVRPSLWRGPERSEIALLDKVNIPLFSHPTMCLSIDLPNGPLVIRLLIGIRARHAPIAFEYSRVMTTPRIRGEGLFEAIQAAFDSSGIYGTPTGGFADTVFDNSSLRRPAEVSDFEITHVYLGIEKPAMTIFGKLESTIVVRSGAIYVDEQHIPCGIFIQSKPAIGPGYVRGDVPAPRDSILQIDGSTVSSIHTRVDNEQGLSFSDTLPMSLQSGHHYFDILASPRVDFVLLYQGTPHRWPSSDVASIAKIATNEYAGKVKLRGGYLVWPVTYDQGWSLALVPPAGPSLTGNALLDAWRTRQYRISPSAHHIANGMVNSWLLPRVDGTAVLIYDADVVAQLGAVIWAVLSGLLVVVALTKGR